MSPFIFVIKSFTSLLYTLPACPERTGSRDSVKSFAADFLMCFQKAAYTEAVFAYLSMEFRRLAR